MSFLEPATYKWSRKPFTNIADIARSLFWTGPRNVLRWLPIIWSDQDWDYVYLLRIMEFKFRRMAHSMEHGPTLSGPRHARELAICAHLCKRLREDDYYLKDMKTGHHWVEYESIRRSDHELLGKLIGTESKTL